MRFNFLQFYGIFCGINQQCFLLIGNISIITKKDQLLQETYQLLQKRSIITNSTERWTVFLTFGSNKSFSSGNFRVLNFLLLTTRQCPGSQLSSMILAVLKLRFSSIGCCRIVTLLINLIF